MKRRITNTKSVLSGLSKSFRLGAVIKTLLTVLIFTLCFTNESKASHFRFGLVTTTRLSETATTVTYRLNVSTSWRLGNAPTSIGFSISGGNTGSVTVPCTNVTDPSGGWTNSTGTANITLNKTATPTRVAYTGCCKISTLLNNPDSNWDVYTIINTNAPGSSPASSFAAINNVPDNAAAATFQIAASDPDPGSTLTYGLPNFASGQLAGQTEPVGFSLSSTGLVTMNTTSAGYAVGQLYNAMATVTDNNGNQIMIDFIIQIVGPSTPPVFDYTVTPSNGQVFNLTVGQNLNFIIRATDTDAGSTVSLSASGLTTYITTANFSPALPATGNPSQTTFSYTPVVAQAGSTTVLNFIATDNVGVQTTTSITISVNSQPAPVFISPTPGAGTMRSILSGATQTDPIVAQSSLGSNVSIAFATLPSGASTSPAVPTAGANPGSTAMSWTPTASQFGSHTFSYTATIAAQPTIFTVHSYSLIVNTLPVFTSTPVLSACSGLSYSYNVVATDANTPYGDVVDIVSDGPLPTWLTLTPTGNGTALLSGSPTAADAGTYTITLVAEDNYHHNYDPVEQTFTITVNGPPVITCPSNISVGNDAGICGASVSYTATATGTPAPTITYSLSSGSVFAVGTTNVTATATNTCGSVSCTFTVTVGDSEAPTAICKNITVQLNAAHTATIAPLDVNDGSSDNCISCSPVLNPIIRMAGIGASQGHRAYDIAFSSGDITGSISRISEAAFNALTPAQLRANYEVLLFTWASSSSLNGDWTTRIKPFIDLGGSVIWEDDVNIGDISGAASGVTLVGGGGSYGCSYVINPSADPDLIIGINGCMVNHHFDITSHTANWTRLISSPSGGGLAVYQTFPSGGRMIIQGPDQDFHAMRGAGDPDGNQYRFILNQFDWIHALQFDPGVPCGFSLDNSSFDCSNLGAPNPVVLTVTDASGNSSTCNAIVTVLDDVYSCNQAPVAVCQNVSVNTDANCEANVTAADVDNGSSDADGDVLIYSISPSGPYALGTTNVILTVTDPFGASSSCNATITVYDGVSPTISCPGDITTGNDAGICDAAVTYSVSFDDNCSGATIAQTAGLASGAAFPKGTTTNTFVVTDGAGNTATCSFTVTVNDTEDPTIACPGDITTGNDAGVCGATITYTVSFDDNCPGSTLAQTAGLPSGSTFPIGTTTNTFVVTDASGTVAAGNTATCSFDVTVNDTENPTISCPGNITTGNDAGVCGAEVTYSVSFDDNCPGASLAQTAGLPSGATFPKGTTTNTFIVTDAAGNTATCSFDVTVNDTEDPTISCPLDITTGNDVGICGAAVTYSIGFRDNCPGATLAQTAGLPSGATFPVGTTTNTFVVTDASHNTATCSFDVTINDVENPTISCPENISAIVNASGCSATVNYNVASGDNCSGVLSQTAGLPSGSAFPLGSTTNTFVVTDPAGNTATCGFTVTVSTTLAVNAGIDEQTYYGYTGDQTVIRAASASGGAGGYSYSWSLSRPLMCNLVNSAGDEVFSGGTCTNNICPGSGSPVIAPSCSGSASVTAKLAQDGDLCVLVTDSKGCVATDCFHIFSEDARCFAGNSGIVKVTICHRTNSATNPWVQICIAQAAVPTHIAENHSDYIGKCVSAKHDEAEGDETSAGIDNSIATSAGEFSMSVFPNPANNILNIEFETPAAAAYQLLIFDNLGRKVLNNEGSAFANGNRISLPVNGLSPGIYYLTLNVGDNLSSVKVIVTH